GILLVADRYGRRCCGDLAPAFPSGRRPVVGQIRGFHLRLWSRQQGQEGRLVLGGAAPKLRREGPDRATQLKLAGDAGPAGAGAVDGQEEIGERHSVTTSSAVPWLSAAEELRTNEERVSRPGPWLASLLARWGGLSPRACGCSPALLSFVRMPSSAVGTAGPW